MQGQEIIEYNDFSYSAKMVFLTNLYDSLMYVPNKLGGAIAIGPSFYSEFKKSDSNGLLGYSQKMIQEDHLVI